MNVATKLPPMRETDYKSRHFDVTIPALVPDVKTWHAGEDVPPLFIQPANDRLSTFEAFNAWVGEHRAAIDNAIFEYGAVLFRGFAMKTVTEFDKLMDNFPRYQEGYTAGMSPRQTVEGKVLESTRLDHDFKICLHSEMAYMNRYPARIALFCKRAAPVGGSTTLGSMDEFMARFPADLRAKLEKHQAHVIRSFSAAGASKGKSEVDHPSHIGWDSAFFTDSKEEVERLCDHLGIQYNWQEDGGLELTETVPIFTPHPRSGKLYYRSNLHTNRTFEGRKVDEEVRAKHKANGHYLDNGEMLTREESDAIMNLYEDVELDWQYQDGDVAIVDNLKCAHGRNPFSGPREVLVALLDR